MNWLVENWVWVLIGIAFIAMHLFGHGGHGSHGKVDKSNRGSLNRDEENQPSNHRH